MHEVFTNKKFGEDYSSIEKIKEKMIFGLE